MTNRVKSMLIIGVLAVSFMASFGAMLSYRSQNVSLARKLDIQQSELEKMKQAAVSAVKRPAPTTAFAEPVFPVRHEAGNRSSIESPAKPPAFVESDSGVQQEERSADDVVAARRNPGRQWLENLREENPARYEAIMSRREEARRAAGEYLTASAEFLLNRDTSTMTAVEKERYTEMSRLFEETLELVGQTTRANMTGNERREILRLLRDNMTALEPVMIEERNREFYQLGRDMGYNRAESAQLVEYLNTVIDLTTMQNLFRSVRPGRQGPADGGAPESR